MLARRQRLRPLTTLLVWTVIGAGAALGLATVGPIVLGWRPFAVLSGSMAPTLRTGDEIVVRPVAPVTLRVGDIVTFNDPSRDDALVTHRVRSMRVVGATVRVVTRGDANTGSEHWSVPASGRVGRLAYRIPKLGYVTGTAGAPLGRILFVVLPALLLGASEIRRVWRPREALKSATEAPITG
jgi:signal peptidase I